jgi:hypothetical protein
VKTKLCPRLRAIRQTDSKAERDNYTGRPKRNLNREINRVKEMGKSIWYFTSGKVCFLGTFRKFGATLGDLRASCQHLTSE